MSSLAQISRSFLAAFKPPTKLSLSAWAERFAVLSAESSAEAGRWKTIAYQRGIMDAFTDPAIEQITCMKSARVGWTKILNNAIGYYIHQDPCPIMVVQPTIEDAQGYSKEEIAPMIRDTPELAELVSESKAKDTDNTILQKMFTGGSLSLIGANSPRGFRRVSRRCVFFDEVDGYPPSAGAEGDQIKLGIKRSEYYHNRKIAAGSTPTVKDASRIQRLFEQSDQRRYFVPCPVCDAPQVLQWKNLKWTELDRPPEQAAFVCEDNGCIIEHSTKRWMIEEADRRALADPSCPYGWRATAPGNGKHAGFHIWAAYSTSPNAAWGQLALEWLESKGDVESLKTFVNTCLGELWEEEYSSKVGADTMQARAEIMDPAIVPAKAVLITFGVDVQDNRIAVSMWGFARGEESWIINHQEIFGDPAQPEIWKQLDEVILRPWRHELGGTMKAAATGIDTGGHYTHEVYQYARERRRHNVVALKGSSIRGSQALSKPKKMDVNYRGQVIKSGVQLHLVGTDTIKNLIFGRLKHNEPGPGYVHISGALTPEFFQQFTSEKQITRYEKGRPIKEWILPPGKRNESLDCGVYANAAMQSLYMRYHRSRIWDIFERALAEMIIKKEPAADPESGALPPETEPNEEKTPLQRAQTSAKITLNKGKSGFVKRW